MTRKQALTLEKQAIDALKAMRLEKKISHETLAQESGVSRAAISMIESGQRHPTMLTYFRIKLALEQVRPKNIS
jgi:transcriptional regulator with XRE-family HTH domain